jgi:hypothetical protein
MMGIPNNKLIRCYHFFKISAEKMCRVTQF